MINEFARSQLLSKLESCDSDDVPGQNRDLLEAAALCVSTMAGADSYETLIQLLSGCSYEDLQRHSSSALVSAVSQLFLAKPSKQGAILWERLPRSVIAEAVEIVSSSSTDGFQKCWQAMTALGTMISPATRRRDGLVLHRVMPGHFWAAHHFTKSIPTDRHKVSALFYLLRHYPEHVAQIGSLLADISDKRNIPPRLKETFLTRLDEKRARRPLESGDALIVASTLEYLDDPRRAAHVLQSSYKTTLPSNIRFEYLIILSRVIRVLDGEFHELRYLATALRVMPDHPSANSIIKKIVASASAMRSKTQTRDPRAFSAGNADILTLSTQLDISLPLQDELVLANYLAYEELPSTSSLKDKPMAPCEELLSAEFVRIRVLPPYGRISAGTDPWSVATALGKTNILRANLLSVKGEDVFVKTASRYSLFFSNGRPIIEACTGHASFFSESNFLHQDYTSLTGQYFSLCVPYGHYNYSHFLLDRIPLLSWISEWRDPISLLFDADAIKYAEPFFRAAGSTARLVPIERGRVYRIEKLNMFSDPQHPLQTGDLRYLNFLRSFVPDWSTRTADRKIIIHRDPGRRGIENQEEFYDFMTSIGFEVIRLENMKIFDQLKLMSEVAVVVGVHGAGLSNIVTCRPGTVVVEILPNRYYTPAFSILGQTAGLQYFPYLEISERNQNLATKLQFSDTHISLATWKNFLRNALASASQSQAN